MNPDIYPEDALQGAENYGDHVSSTDGDGPDDRRYGHAGGPREARGLAMGENNYLNSNPAAAGHDNFEDVKVRPPRSRHSSEYSRTMKMMSKLTSVFSAACFP